MTTTKTLHSSFAALSCSLLGALALAVPASADFSNITFDGVIAKGDGSTYSQAGGHPYAQTATVTVPSSAASFNKTNEDVKKVEVDLPAGVIANPLATPTRCTFPQLAEAGEKVTECPPSSQVGVVEAYKAGGGPESPFFTSGLQLGLYNMVAPPGMAAVLAFKVSGVTTLLVPHLRSNGDYGLIGTVDNILQAQAILGSRVTMWGNLADPSHDTDRGTAEDAGLGNFGFYCVNPLAEEISEIECTNPFDLPSGASPKAFLTLPTNCSAGRLTYKARVTSWQHQDVIHTRSYDTDTNGNSTAITGCDKVPFSPSIDVATTTDQAETPSGLEVGVDVSNPGLTNPDAIAQANIKESTLTLPEGVTLNPSAAEGLGVCSPAQYQSTKLSFDPTQRQGCPANSKLGTVAVKTPLIEETIPGNVYLATPYDNPFNSLLALYIVLEEPERDALVKLPGEVRTNEQTGRIEATLDNLPQIPFSSFDFKFREGARAPLVSPPNCGIYTAETDFIPWSAEDPDHPKPSEVLHRVSRFKVTKGVGGGPCPPGGVPPFHPGFSAGSINNSAGSHTPFILHVTRQDGEQDMTRFSAVLPPGLLGKLAGIDKCPLSAIATAKSKTGFQEIASPSCPANSLIGHSLAGAGVGSVLTYVPGKVYLGGPFHGDPLSVIAITPVVAGPFDVGTVAVHEALTLNPKTAEVEVDGAASDPIPHILKGIPAKLRDLRVFVDRPDFILNPTNCDPSSADATLFGGYLDVLSAADDVPVSLSDRFQAASCSALGFKPKLALQLKGGTKRGGHPGLKATYRPRTGDANLKGLVVRLPRSAFLDQAHIRTICTRVQFAADSCPKAAQYGFIKAWTPLLDTPLEGPVWLRSSDHKLPDLVFDLHGLVDVEVATRIDSAKGGIRATLDSSPDAPLSKVILRMQGAKKGLIINSRNLCGAVSKANVQFEGHNGKEVSANPEMRADCGGKRRHKRHRG